MIKKAGVYTAKCPGCGRSILVHLASDGSVSPSECPDCHVEFAGIDNGEQRNTFVAIVKIEKSKWHWRVQGGARNKSFIEHLEKL